jgi:hypothetical protein
LGLLASEISEIQKLTGSPRCGWSRSPKSKSLTSEVIDQGAPTFDSRSADQSG